MDDLNDENLQKKPVVVLTRLPEFTLNALQPPTPQQFDSEAESPDSCDSDMLWEPEDDSGDSDFGAKKKTQHRHKMVNDVNVPSPLVNINNNSTSNNSSVCNNDSGSKDTNKGKNLSIHKYKLLITLDLLECLRSSISKTPYCNCVSPPIPSC